MEKTSVMGVVVALMLVLGVVLGATSCSTIEPGYVGIKVNQWGSQRGVDDFPILTGRVFVNPITEKVYQYPTFLQNVIWDKEDTDRDKGDHSLTFNSVEGAVVNADIALSYGFEPKKVPNLFVEFRQDAAHITEVYVRSQVRDAFSRYASQMKVVDIFGEGKQKLLDQTKKYLDEHLAPKGFKFDSVSFVGALRVDPKVEAAINSVISATQRAIEAQNKVVQSKAEADQQIEKARGEAQSAVLAAEGEAKAILSKATAQAQANKLQAESLNANLLQWNALQKWDGKLPQFNGSTAIPFLQVQPNK
jgi:regulator of protease activity HflC (stomatin/prohibitin superfamily)